MQFIKFKIVLISLLFSLNALAQDYYSQFKAINSKDTLARQELLKEWEGKNSNDPELYTCYFNHYYSMARSSGLAIEQVQKGEESFLLTDSTGEVAGYLNSATFYEPTNIEMALKYIDKGISLFPERLDMRFGKVYVLGMLEDYEAFTNEIIKAVDHFAVSKKNWQWTLNEEYEDSKEFMLSTIQTYVNQLYESGDHNLVYIKKIGEAVLKHYPNHVESMSNISIYYMLNGDFKSALEPLLKAEKVAPDDYVVLSNIAHCYYMLKDEKKAIKYYEILLKKGGDSIKALATERLDELKK